MRIKKLRNNLRKEGKFPYLVSDLNNIRYLTGYTGSFAYLVVDARKSFFITDSRYEEYARTLLTGDMELVLLKKDIFSTVKGIVKDLGMKKLYLEEHSLPLSNYLEMNRQLRGVRLLPGRDEVNIIRMIKDEGEIDILRKAAGITDRCVDHLKGVIKPGITEWDISIEIENFYKRNGCRRTSFNSIVASGRGSSMPHYETSFERKIEKGDIVLIDMGCEYMGYNSDLTRTMFVGSIDPLFEAIYAIVRRAQESAVAAVKPGITVGKLDSITRNIISHEGYGDNFGHSLGHGVGLEVHELPAVKQGPLRLRKNMTITIEPGIYIPGKGGIRIEDMVLVTDRGHEVLTHSSKDIIIL